ncbi:MAG: hypothetical protein A2103_04770 [Gammaproteobacteria bacterium GWF2_41_13]|nr:MAG: hypothetical protein A2103_04770 [Gammaproteobacteria bacterium GWF2_41_13]
MKTSVKQPAGLKVFCGSILFERYGFYLVQSLLILYLVKFFRMDDNIAYGISGSFIALSYITPLIGGFIADKYWGLKRSVFIGSLIECLGVICLLLPWQLMMHLGLSILAVGVGLLKPSASSLLGYLYKENDPHQDAGYTIFYMAFCIGITIAASIAGFLVRYLGWSFAFLTAIAAFIMTYLIFYFGIIHYRLQNLGKNTKTMTQSSLVPIAITLCTILLSFIILTSEWIAIVVFIAVSISVIGIFIYCITKSEKRYKNTLVAFFILLIISVFFWAMYMQLFLSILLFIENVVDKSLLGINIPSSAFISIEAFGIVIFGYPLAKLWLFLGKTKYNPSIPAKFGISMVLLSISFAILASSFSFKETSALINPLWIIIAYLILSIAELAFSPIGLSMVKTLVPPEFNGMMMGIFLLTIGLGGKIAGTLAKIAKVPAAMSHNISAIGIIYHHAFSVYLLILLICTLITILFIPYIHKKIKQELPLSLTQELLL